jgi:hypothetical protein
MYHDIRDYDFHLSGHTPADLSNFLREEGFLPEQDGIFVVVDADELVVGYADFCNPDELADVLAESGETKFYLAHSHADQSPVMASDDDQMMVISLVEWAEDYPPYEFAGIIISNNSGEAVHGMAKRIPRPLAFPADAPPEILKIFTGRASQEDMIKALEVTIEMLKQRNAPSTTIASTQHILNLMLDDAPPEQIHQALAEAIKEQQARIQAVEQAARQARNTAALDINQILGLPKLDLLN